MSRARHMEKRADGGRATEEDPKPYNAQGSNVEKEAEEGRKNGGRMKKKAGGMVEGHEKKKRLDRPGRKRGGKIGADMAPLSSAAKIRNASEHDATDDGNAEED